MSVNVEQLLADHGGRIEKVMFPDLDSTGLASRLAAYLTLAETAAGSVDAGTLHDEAVSEYVYHLAFMAVYRRASAAPSSQAMQDEASLSYTQEQIDAFYTMATEARSRFDDILAEAGTPLIAATAWPSVKSYRGGA